MLVRCDILVWLAVLAIPAGIGAQGTPTRFQITSLYTEDSVVRVNYFVPFEGYIEMRLYDNMNRVVGRNHFINNVGEHETVVHRGWMQAGKTYRLAFIYKGQMYDREFVNEY
jgi:hypothetical protein